MSGQQGPEGEMGSGSGGGDSPHGLRFGEKLYFEGLGGGGGHGGEAGEGASSGVPASSSGMPTSALAPVESAAVTPRPAAPAVAPKRGKGVVQGGQPPPPPRCQVEGCRVDLTGVKAYYFRHKVCGMHSKAPKVVVAGLEQRFCQQCSRFHQLAEFDQVKRSCRRRLAGHNERRRKPQPGSLAFHYGQLPSSFHEDNGRYGGFLVDFSQPRLSAAARDVWPTVRADDGSRGVSSRCQDGPYTSSGGIATNMTQFYLQGSGGGTILSDPKLPPSSSFGVSTPSFGCALSLLSSEPKGATATSNRAPTISGNNYEGSPLTQAGASAGFTKTAWSLQGTSSSTLEIPCEVSLGQAAEQGDGHSSGELELALHGNKQCMDPGDVRVYSPGNPMH